MIHALTPWRILIRNGIPPLKVARRPILVGEVMVGVGQTLDPELFPPQIRRERLRQFYEARRLEPVNPLPDSQQFYRERFEHLHGGGLAPETPVAPITPVASRIAAGDLPPLDVPVAEEPPRPKSKPKRL